MSMISFPDKLMKRTPAVLLLAIAPVALAAVPAMKPSDLAQKQPHGPYAVQIDFESQDEGAFQCAVELAKTQKVSFKVSYAGSNTKSVSFARTYPNLNTEADNLVAAAMKCRFTEASKLSWSVSTTQN